jgi:hypothetical protein
MNSDQQFLPEAPVGRRQPGADQVPPEKNLMNPNDPVNRENAALDRMINGIAAVAKYWPPHLIARPTTSSELTFEYSLAYRSGIAAQLGIDWPGPAEGWRKSSGLDAA